MDVGTLDRSVDGLVDAVKAFGTPLISGKDSLGQQGKLADGTVIKAPPTMVTSAHSVLDSLLHVVPSHFQQTGSTIVLVGSANPRELAGSTASSHLGVKTNKVPNKKTSHTQRQIIGCDESI